MTSPFRVIINRAMALAGGKQTLLAEALGISEGCLSKKVNGDSGWFEGEIDGLIRAAGLIIVPKREIEEGKRALITTIRILTAELDTRPEGGGGE